MPSDDAELKSPGMGSGGVAAAGLRGLELKSPGMGSGGVGKSKMRKRRTAEQIGPELDADAEAERAFRAGFDRIIKRGRLGGG